MRPFLAFALAFAFVVPLAVHSQDAAVPQHPTSTPYSGDLSIFEDKDRADKLQIDRVMDTLHIDHGKTVADIGAGGGWFTVRAARRVGRTGRVFAEDINQHAIESIRQRAGKERLANVVPVLGTPDDATLPAASVDAALLLRVYHEIAHPALFLASLRTSLRTGALVGVIDHPGHGDDHGINPEVVRAEMERNGFRFLRQYDFTHADQNDFFLVFTPAPVH